MRPVRYLIALFCLWLFATTLNAGEPSWIEVHSEHFSVITDAGERNGRHVADLFEQMRAAFGVLFVRTKINQPVPLQIVAFRNTRELRRYSPLFKGKVVEVAGFYLQGEDRDFVVVDMSQENNWEIVFHEYAHLLLSGNFPPTAPWFDEGFAEYLSTMKISSNGTVQVGLPIRGVELLDQPGKFRLLDLFQVEHHSETYNQSGQQRDMFYAESWLVAHYLFDSNQLSPAARYFVLTNQQKVPIPDAVQQAFGVSLEQMENTIWTNWRSGKLYAKTARTRIPTTFSASVHPLEPLEARAQLADVYLHSADYEAKAVQELEEILRENPNQVAAQRALGYAYLRRRDLAKAREHFQIAARLGSDDPRVYYYFAVLLQQSEPNAIGSEEFRQDLQRAIQLDPEYAEAYHLLGLGLMRAGNYAAAEQNVRRAIDLSPRNEMFRLNLAVLLVNQRKVAEGKAVLQSLANSSDPRIAQQAYQMMLIVSKNDSLSPADEGSPDDSQ